MIKTKSGFKFLSVTQNFNTIVKIIISISNNSFTKIFYNIKKNWNRQRVYSNKIIFVYRNKFLQLDFYRIQQS